MLSSVYAIDPKVLYFSEKVLSKNPFSCVRRHFLILILFFPPPNTLDEVIYTYCLNRPLRLNKPFPSSLLASPL